MGNLLQNGPSPAEKEAALIEFVDSLPPEKLTRGTIMRKAQELGFRNPVMGADWALKGVDADRKRMKELLPDPASLPQGTVPVTPQILDLLSQANLPTTGLSEPAPLPAPLGMRVDTGMPLSLPDLAALVPPIKEMITQGRVPGPVVGSQKELTLFGGPARNALPQQPVEGAFVPNSVVTEAAGRAGKPSGSQQFAPQVQVNYIPVGKDQFQLMTVDRVSGQTKPVLKDGKPIVLTEKQVLISEGKKAQSIIDPFETRFLSKLGDSEAVRLTEMKKTALEAVESKKILSEGLALVNSGIYTGSAANIKLAFNKWLQEAGIDIGGRKAANTEAYAGLMGLQVGKVIKAFGSGTGLSDADRDYAEKIAGGKITLTEESIRKLLDINSRLADFAVMEYNSQAERAKQQLELQDYIQPIEMPNFNAAPPAVDLSSTPTEELLEMLGR